MSPTRIRRLGARTVLAALSVSAVGLAADVVAPVRSAVAVEYKRAAVPTSALDFPLGNTDDPAVGQAAAALGLLADGRDPDAYRSALEALAGSIGPRVDIDPARLVAAWAQARPEEMTVLLSALTQLGVGYRYASSQPGAAFDCSGLVRWAWSRAGIDLPANSGQIIRWAPNTPVSELEPGDVMWYPGHVMLALGVDDAYVHAVGRGKVLEVRSMYAKHKRKIRAIDPLG